MTDEERRQAEIRSITNLTKNTLKQIKEEQKPEKKPKSKGAK